MMTNKRNPTLNNNKIIMRHLNAALEIAETKNLTQEDAIDSVALMGEKLTEKYLRTKGFSIKERQPLNAETFNNLKTKINKLIS